MSGLHRVVGFAVVGVFTVGWVWGLVAWISRKGPGPLFWRWVAVAQVLAGLQAVMGIVLLLFGKRVVTGGPLSNVLHYVYGLLPLLLFVFARSVRPKQMNDAHAKGTHGAILLRSSNPMIEALPARATTCANTNSRSGSSPYT